MRTRRGGSFHRSTISNQISFFTFHLCLLVSLILILSGCKETFQPIDENDNAPFSIFGYLDASADTQWVRVTPVREQLTLPPVAPEMNITVEHPESGRMGVFEDSLFRFPDGFHILNAWSATDILEPEYAYHLKAERPEGATSRVEVTFPEDFPIPVLEIYDVVNVYILRIEGVERLISVQWQARAHVVSESAGWDYIRVFRKLVTDYVRQTEPGKYILRSGISRGGFVSGMIPDPPQFDLEVEILDLQIFVASAGPEWNEDISTLDDRTYSLPGVISNVENGTGYLFGIVSKSIPIKSCFHSEGEFTACPEEKPLR